MQSVKLIPLVKTLEPFVKGKHRSGQIYRSFNSISEQPIQLLIVAGEKDVWRVSDALITGIKNNPDNQKFLSSFVIASSTAGEGYIPNDFFDDFKNQPIENIYICYDLDEAGKKGSSKVYALAKTVIPKGNCTILLFDDNKPVKLTLVVCLK